jgi:rhodanese-related sulfurtransferase
MATGRIVTLNEIAAALRAGDYDEFWNVLTQEYFSGEMIPGSRWVPVDRVGREVAARALDKNARMLVYCSGPSCPNSRDAGAKLVTLGFTNVCVFEGGLEAWKADGRGVEVLKHATAA